MDFNHIYSNIGYIIFGIMFILFVKMRDISIKLKDRTLSTYDIVTDPNNNGDLNCCGKLLPPIVKSTDTGTNQNFGAQYALGFALFMEGILSASYHVCPNKSSFQFGELISNLKNCILGQYIISRP